MERALGLTMHQCNLCVLRGPKYKYVHFGGKLPGLLFDITAGDGSGELLNLAEDPAHQAGLQEAMGKMLSWRMNHMSRELTGTRISETSAAAGGPVAGRLGVVVRQAHLYDKEQPGQARPLGTWTPSL